MQIAEPTIPPFVKENEPMSKHTSFKVGGPARYFAKVSSMESLKSALSFAREKNLPHFILGNGTNLLVSDKGYEGVVISFDGDALFADGSHATVRFSAYGTPATAVNLIGDTEVLDLKLTILR